MNAAPTALTEPRSFGGVAFRIGAMAFLPFALTMAWLVSCLTGYAFGQVLPFALAGGAVFSVMFGLNNARFLQVETATFDAADPGRFVAVVNLTTSRLGYYPAARSDGFHGYRPAFQTGWAAGWISVQFLGPRAVVIGPRVFVRKVVEDLAAAGHSPGG
ncbi:MAG: hypothetical protein U0797_08810 [Gemmataceae bacterium]